MLLKNAGKEHISLKKIALPAHQINLREIHNFKAITLRFPNKNNTLQTFVEKFYFEIYSLPALKINSPPPFPKIRKLNFIPFQCIREGVRIFFSLSSANPEFAWISQLLTRQ